MSALTKGGMNGVADDSGGQMYEQHETSSMHDDHRLEKSPSHPLSGRPPGINDSRDNGILSKLSRVFGKQTAEQPVVQDPQFTYYPCRWPECKYLVRNDQVGRLGGFCCDTEAQ
jgi:hypothetical protein